MCADRHRHAEDPLIPAEWLAKEVAVVGLGRTGLAIGEWLAGRGVRVYASDADAGPELVAAAQRLRDKPGVAVDLGGHDLSRIQAAAAVVVSPGVPPDAAPLVTARQHGIEVVAELDLAARALRGVNLLVVTGTNGKSTTTALIAHVLQEAGVRAEAGGNIGRPLVELAGATERLDWVVVEASSFQLHDSPHLNPTVGLVTNLAPDHLDRYDNVEAYYADKKLIFQNATEDSFWILNADDDGVLALANGMPGRRAHWSLRAEADAWWDRSSGHLVLGGQRVVTRDRVPLLGEHNVANALAAMLAASAVGVPVPKIARGLETFRTLPHRLEPVGEVEDVQWINDSKATNVASTSVALRAMHEPFVLLAGGYDKGDDFGALAGLLAGCRRVIAYGQTAEALRRGVEAAVEVTVAATLEEAVALARSVAQPHDTVLLSPACASFDQFRDFEERGEAFRQLVTAP